MSLSARRHWSRRLAMQALYQWQLSGDNLRDIEAQFLTDENMPKADLDYFRALLHGVPGCLDEIDRLLGSGTDREISRVDPVERAILRIAAYELMERAEVPYRVVIDEAVALAKKFGAEQGYRFVNGVLDRISATQRPLEVRTRHSG